LVSVRRRPTLLDVAALAGVSRTTASNAYNQSGRMSPAARERVLSAGDELGYPGPNPAARSLRRGRADAVGVALGESLAYAFDDPAAVLFLSGLSAGLLATGTALHLLPVAEQSTSRVLDAVIDGLVVWALADDHPLPQEALRRGLPMVTHGGPRLAATPYVGIDGEAASAAVAMAALRGGRRRPALIAFPFGRARHGESSLGPDPAQATSKVTRDRLNGYRRALTRTGHDWHAVPVIAAARNDRQHGREAALALLRTTVPPDVILAMSDELAIGVCAAAAEQGLTVPGDVAVTGFDDLAAADSSPPLTTIRQDLRAQGRLCSDILLHGDTGRAELSPWSLIERAST